MRFFQNVLGFAAAFAAVGTSVLAAPVASNELAVRDTSIVARSYPATLAGVVDVLAKVKADVEVAVGPLATVDINADIVADVKVKLIAAIKVGVDACVDIQAKIGVLAALDIAAVIQIAVSLCAIIQIIVTAIAKVTCGCVVEAIIDLCAAIDAELVLLIKICLSLCGSLGATLIVQVVVALKAVLDINLLVKLNLHAVVAILGL